MVANSADKTASLYAGRQIELSSNRRDPNMTTLYTLEPDDGGTWFRHVVCLHARTFLPIGRGVLPSATFYEHCRRICLVCYCGVFVFNHERTLPSHHANDCRMWADALSNQSCSISEGNSGMVICLAMATHLSKSPLVMTR